MSTETARPLNLLYARPYMNFPTSRWHRSRCLCKLSKLSINQIQKVTTNCWIWKNVIKKLNLTLRVHHLNYFLVITRPSEPHHLRSTTSTVGCQLHETTADSRNTPKCYSQRYVHGPEVSAGIFLELGTQNSDSLQLSELANFHLEHIRIQTSHHPQKCAQPT